MKKLFDLFLSKVALLSALPPLFFRLVLMYGFYTPSFVQDESGNTVFKFAGPSFEKLRGFDGVVTWFRDGLHLPFPLLNAYLATGTELIGIALLTIGLATRLVSIPLMVVMCVAIATVHFKNGYACSENGFEIPFYYLLMLFSLFVTGPGRISVDHLLKRKFSK